MNIREVDSSFHLPAMAYHRASNSMQICYLW